MSSLKRPEKPIASAIRSFQVVLYLREFPYTIAEMEFWAAWHISFVMFTHLSRTVEAHIDGVLLSNDPESPACALQRLLTGKGLMRKGIWFSAIVLF